VAFEDGKQDQVDACASENSEADGQTSETDTDRVVAVDIECLSWPELLERELAKI
jgi:hypothetical protein